MRHFIILDHEPWTINSHNTFYDMFEKAGIKPEVWDLSQILHPGFHLPDEKNDYKYLSRFNFISAIISKLSAYDSADIAIIVCIPLNWETRKIFKFLKKRGIPLIRIESYGNTISTTSLKVKLLNLLHAKLLEYFTFKIKGILSRLYYRFNSIGFDYLLSSNSNSNRTNNLNHPDYDRHLTHGEVNNGNYLVFSDVYFPLHPDIKYQYHNYVEYCEITYYNRMKFIFDFLEQRYNIPIIIAAHPKSNYKGTEFGNRKIVKNKTNELIANSKGVIFHYSCTLSYIVLYNKPVCMIAVPEFKLVPHILPSMESISRIIHIPINYIDSEDCNDIELKYIPEEIREKYKYTYLTSKKTENQTNSEILKGILTKI